MSRPDQAARARRYYIDWARGLAVLIMIQAHVLDAWTRLDNRATFSYRYLTMLGGFAAPLFLWLAGVALVLSAERQQIGSGSRWTAAERVVKRGLEIFVLAFLFRLQAFVISPGSWAVTIFRVDILNIMGPAIVLAGLVWGLAGGALRAAAASAAAAALIAMVTPVVRAASWVDVLPLWIQWHLRPFGDHTTFTLFPWSGFVFGGAACGAILSKVATVRSERRTLVALGAAGGLLIWVGFYTASLPSIYRASSFWTSSPTYFAIRAGVMLLVLAVLYGLTPLARLVSPPFDVLETFGRNSLFIYWIHVELVYGYASWGLRRNLPVWGSAVGYVLFCALMYGAVHWRDRILESWRLYRGQKAEPRPITA